MGNRIMIVVWKWSLQWTKDRHKIIKGWKFCDFIGKISQFPVKVEYENYIFIGFTKHNTVYTKNNGNYSSTKPEYNVKEIVKKCNCLLKENSNKILLLLHSGKPDKLSEEMDEFEDLKGKKNIVINSFKAGYGSIYKNIIDGNKTYFLEDAIEDQDSEEIIIIKKECFEKVWNDYHYINLNQKKNRLIKLWLPLAIDIQGLSEYKGEEREKYFDEVSESYSKEIIERIEKTLEEIKKEIEKEDIEIYEKGKYKEVLEFLSKENSDWEEFCNNYCDSSSPDKFFLPTWLQNVAKEFDDKKSIYQS